MEWYQINVDGQRTLKFAEKSLPAARERASSSVGSHANADLNFRSGGRGTCGGIIKRGEWLWLAKDSTLHIRSARSGQLIATFQWSDGAAKNCRSCCITCVEELYPGNKECVLLAICLENVQCSSGHDGSLIALFSVDHSRVLSYIELEYHVTCARFLNALVCRRSLLQNFDGCLVLGTEEGVVLALDVNIQRLLRFDGSECKLRKRLRIVEYDLPLADIHREFTQCQSEPGTYFALSLEVIEFPSPIRCLQAIDLVLSLAVGYEDGRLAFYDLAEMQVFYISEAQRLETECPILKIDFLEPPDDPRPCLYVWALHEGQNSVSAVLHLLTYERRALEENSHFYYFETFRSGYERLFLPLENVPNCRALACQSVSKEISHDEEGVSSLCAFVWYSSLEEKNKLLIFDLNQWYKEQMPHHISCHRNATCLAGYKLDGLSPALDAYINPQSIAYFNSFQRFEEHFYPNSISFDCSLLLRNGLNFYNWEGAQNKFINVLRSSNSVLFLEPDPYFHQIIRTRLMPQFLEQNYDSTFSKNAKYELILSVALENNCLGLVRDCAKAWSDGSFSASLGISTGLSLSTLTDWIWKRATCIKRRCNDLCQRMLAFNGHPLDSREQKELGFVTRQLKMLADLLADVLPYAKNNVPYKMYSNLESRQQSLQLSSEYHEVILWLLNIGLLTELSSYPENPHLYPYGQLKPVYDKKRTLFAKINQSFVSKKTGSCHLIFIDAFIERECSGNALREQWLDNNNKGLYPPKSIESLLHILLVPDVEFSKKCAILLYFFLDLHMTTNLEAYGGVVNNFIKFPSVFKLTAPLIKTVQAFWNLDHGHFLPAVDEFVTPLNNTQNYPQWLVELLIEALLSQDAAQLALRVLEARPSLVSPVLKLRTLLCNELIPEAFHFARSLEDRSLLVLFFNSCLYSGNFGIIRDLALSDGEAHLMQEILKNSKAQGAGNLHVVYLLQKYKYLEAVSHMNELANGRVRGIGRTNLRYNALNYSMDTPNLVLSAYNTTMPPLSQGLTDVYLRIKNKLMKKESANKLPMPLSSQLIKQNANDLLGGVYRSSALSAHTATYWSEICGIDLRDDESSLNNCKNAPFLRKPQEDLWLMDYEIEDNCNVSYPLKHRICEKRPYLEADDFYGGSGEYIGRRETYQQQPKKRRRLIEETIADLHEFSKSTINSTSKRLNLTGFSFGAAQAEVTEIEQNNMDSLMTESFLTTPYEKEAERYARPKPSGTPELHGILKTSTEARRPSCQRELMANEEEKNLRFKLPTNSPTPTLTPTDNTRNALLIEPDEEDEGDTQQSMEIVVEIDTGEDANEEDVEEEGGLVVHKVTTEEISVASNTPTYEPEFSSNSTTRNIPPVRDSGLISSSHEEASNAEQERSSSRRPQPRKPLERESVASAAEFSSDRWVTAHTGSALQEVKASDLLSQTSSGVSSLGVARLPGNYTMSGYVTAASTCTSKIHEFEPKISSSKVCETQSMFADKITTNIKYTECTTVIGNLTSVESLEESPPQESVGDEPTARGAPVTAGTENDDLMLKRPMLDTTLEMSPSVFTAMETTEDITGAGALAQALHDKGVPKTPSPPGPQLPDYVMEVDVPTWPSSVIRSEVSEDSSEQSDEDMDDQKQQSEDDDVVIISSSSSSEIDAAENSNSGQKQTNSEDDEQDDESEEELEEEEDEDENSGDHEIDLPSNSSDSYPTSSNSDDNSIGQESSQEEDLFLSVNEEDKSHHEAPVVDEERQSEMPRNVEKEAQDELRPTQESMVSSYEEEGSKSELAQEVTDVPEDQFVESANLDAPPQLEEIVRAVESLADGAKLMVSSCEDQGSTAKVEQAIIEVQEEEEEEEVPLQQEEADQSAGVLVAATEAIESFCEDETSRADMRQEVIEVQGERLNADLEMPLEREEEVDQSAKNLAAAAESIDVRQDVIEVHEEHFDEGLSANLGVPQEEEEVDSARKELKVETESMVSSKVEVEEQFIDVQGQHFDKTLSTNVEVSLEQEELAQSVEALVPASGSIESFSEKGGCKTKVDKEVNEVREVDFGEAHVEVSLAQVDLIQPPEAVVAVAEPSSAQPQEICAKTPDNDMETEAAVEEVLPEAEVVEELNTSAEPTTIAHIEDSAMDTAERSAPIREDFQENVNNETETEPETTRSNEVIAMDSEEVSTLISASVGNAPEPEPKEPKINSEPEQEEREEEIKLVVEDNDNGNANEGNPPETSVLTRSTDESSDPSHEAEKGSDKSEQSPIRLLPEYVASTPSSTRRGKRSSSVQPQLDMLEFAEAATTSQKRRSTRATSVPPQTSADNESAMQTQSPYFLRRLRRLSSHSQRNTPDRIGDSEHEIGHSNSPRSVLSEHRAADAGVTVDTPKRQLSRRTSQPPETTRRLSMLVDENPALSDSPSRHTRSHGRLASVESDISNSPLTVKLKGTKSLVGSVASEADGATLTPKKSRRRSMASNQSDGSLTPKGVSRVSKLAKGKAIIEVVENEIRDAETPQKSDAGPATTAVGTPSMYTEARRLTRTQLAMFEKLAAIHKSSDISASPLSGNDGVPAPSPSPSPPVKGATRKRSARATPSKESNDDIESVSSRKSTASSRRVTRRSGRAQSEPQDDDSVSVTSSAISERKRPRRQKQPSHFKGSPGSLHSIPEEDDSSQAGDVPKKRGRKAKTVKK